MALQHKPNTPPDWFKILGVSFLMVVAINETTLASEPAPEITIDIVEFEGWRTARLSNGEVELSIPLDIGPRIISFRLVDGENVFKVYDDQIGTSGEDEWVIRGGHRLWVAPEDGDRTYVPDNDPVNFEVLGRNRFLISGRPDPTFGLVKEIEIELPLEGTKVEVLHRIRNTSSESTRLAPWALSVMAPGGLEFIPLPQEAVHLEEMQGPGVERFAPKYGMAFWPYANIDDPRFTIETELITVRQDPEAEAETKIGLATALGVASYANRGALFIKRFPYDPAASYPDFGSNYETYTNDAMLEMESLGPLVELGPDETTIHSETWELIDLGDVRLNFEEPAQAFESVRSLMELE